MITYDNAPMSLRRLAFLVMTHSSFADIARIAAKPRAELYAAAGLEAGEAEACLAWLLGERISWGAQSPRRRRSRRGKGAEPTQQQLGLISVISGARKAKQPAAAGAQNGKEARRRGRSYNR